MSTIRRALILVDVQQQYFAGPLEIQYPQHVDSLPKITAAIDAAAAAGIPIAVIQHTAGAGAPVFNPETPAFELHAEVARRSQPEWKSITKQYGSVFAGTDLLEWLREREVDTVTLVGYMTNNCIVASAAQSETFGLSAEVLSDATGAINITNDAGSVDAETVHRTLMAVLNSNFAAVATTDAWMSAVTSGAALLKDNLLMSATRGAHE